MGRYDPIEAPATCMIRIKRDGKWYQMRSLAMPISYSRRVIARLRRMGREVNVTWLQGVG